MSDGHGAGHGENEAHKASEDWTKTQQNQITSLYNELKGDYKKAADKALFGGPQLPYQQAHSILTENLRIQEHAGLEGKVNHSKSQSSKSMHKSGLDYLTALFGGTAFAASIAAVAPPLVGILGIAAAAYALMPKYNSSKHAEAH